MATGDIFPSSFVPPFATGALEARVKTAPDAEHVRLLPKDWKEEYFAERVFLTGSFNGGTRDSKWMKDVKNGGFAGHTPFVLEGDFRDWLARHVSEIERQFDPADEPFWTPVMALAWIGSRSKARVREQWEKFRSRHRAEGDGPSTGSITMLKAKFLDGLAPEFTMTPTQALLDLKRALAAGELPSFGKPGFLTSPISPPLWARLDDHVESPSYRDYFIIEADPKSGQERVEIRDVLLPSADLMRIWPANDADIAAQPVLSVAIEGRPRQPASPSAIKRDIEAALAHCRRMKVAPLTRQEAVPLLVDVYEGDMLPPPLRRRVARQKARDVIADIIAATGKRRPEKKLSNRNNELSDLRRYLAATIQQRSTATNG